MVLAADGHVINQNLGITKLPVRTTNGDRLGMLVTGYNSQNKLSALGVGLESSYSK